MNANIIDSLVLWFLELFDSIDARAKDGQIYYKSLAEKLRSYSRTIAEYSVESPHYTLLFMLSKASLRCIQLIIENLGSGYLETWTPRDYLEYVLSQNERCSADKIAYATLFLASLSVYSNINGIDINKDNFVDSIKSLLSDIARIDSPYHEIMEDLYSGIKRVAEAALQEKYDQ